MIIPLGGSGIEPFTGAGTGLGRANGLDASWAVSLLKSLVQLCSTGGQGRVFPVASAAGRGCFDASTASSKESDSSSQSKPDDKGEPDFIASSLSILERRVLNVGLSAAGLFFELPVKSISDQDSVEST